MIIKPSASIRNGYKEISDTCKQTGEPIVLTNKGEGDLIVMSLESYEEERQTLRIQAELLRYERDKMNGNVTFSPFDDVMGRLGASLDRVTGETSGRVDE